MSTVRELHQAAMELAELATAARITGGIAASRDLLRQAMHQEIQAAEIVASNFQAEPTRSVLLRSAASLALQCGEWREAERLISVALAASPPASVAEELRDLLEQTYFERHLSLRGIVLEPQELQLSIAGKMAGAGITLSEAFVGRVQDIQRLVVRTVERKLGRAFREHGQAPASIVKQWQLFLLAPRPGSFTVTLRIGRPEQPLLPGLEDAFEPEIIDDLLTNFELLNSSREDELHRRIPEESYYRNFVGLAKQIAPDGQTISFVGLTSQQGEQERRVQITRYQNTIRWIGETETGGGGEMVTVTGRLLFADSTKGSEGRIDLIDATKERHKIRVPEGMMTDIVRPLYEDEVTVTGVKRKGLIFLQNIERVVPA